MHLAKEMAVGLVLLGLGALLVLKPMRILLPQMAGVTCAQDRLCLENPGQVEKATAMYRRALTDVEAKLGPLDGRPRVVFCSTTSCFRSFGFDGAAAQSIGAWGIVVGPRGWQDHYLRHELIHHWQAERLGSISRWRAPAWLIEGMAYALSEDPRNDLGEPLQSYRSRFLEWYEELDGELAQALRAAAY